MKIELSTSAKAVECANAILAQAIKALTESREIREKMSFSPTDLQNADKFRKSLVKAFLKPLKS